METWLPNIFKTTIVTKLTKIILESSYRLKGSLIFTQFDIRIDKNHTF